MPSYLVGEPQLENSLLILKVLPSQNIVGSLFRFAPLKRIVQPEQVTVDNSEKAAARKKQVLKTHNLIHKELKRNKC